MFPGPQLGEKCCHCSCWTFPGKSPCPHVQTESDCSHHWRPPRENGSGLCEGGEPQLPRGRVLAPHPGRGEGAPRTLLVSSCWAPAHYCLKPHSPVPMEQVGVQEKGSRRIRVVTRFQGWRVGHLCEPQSGSWV